MKQLYIAAVLAGAAVAMPSAAQAQDEDIVVYGHYGRVPDNAPTASQVVSYADLDLSTDWGRHELRHRINLTARYLCDKLGENSTGDALAPPCREAAARDALKRIGTIEAHFAPRGTAWTRPHEWAPPYETDWAAKYPDDPY